MAGYTTRYGYSSEVDETNFDKIFSDLLEELKTEKFDEPDEEHTQVSVDNEHWAVTAQVSGLITFDNIDMLEGNPTHLPETMYLRDISDDELRNIWLAIINNNEEELLSHNWMQLDELPAYESDYYRKMA